MSRDTWESIKNSKSFFVSTYRRVGTMVIVSLLINLVLAGGIYYVYFNQPPRDYYATNGITPPVKLNALTRPNESSEALLPPDPESSEEAKVVPQ